MAQWPAVDLPQNANQDGSTNIGDIKPTLAATSVRNASIQTLAWLFVLGKTWLLETAKLCGFPELKQLEQLFGTVNFWTVNETAPEPELLARLLVVAGEECRERLPAVMDLLLGMAIFMVLSGIDGNRSYGASILFNRPRIYMPDTKKFVDFSTEEERLV